MESDDRVHLERTWRIKRKKEMVSAIFSCHIVLTTLIGLDISCLNNVKLTNGAILSVEIP